MLTVEEIKRVIDSSKRPAAIHDVQVEFGNDSTGEPAIWIQFFVDGSVASSPELMAEISGFAQRVRSTILSRDQDRWPFVEFKVPA